jgi:predicted helicase
LFSVWFPGVKTSRDDFLVDMEKDALVERLAKYFDPALSHEEMKRMTPGVMDNSARFKAVAVREQLRQRGFLNENVVRYCYRPFDVRWLYWEPRTKLLDEKRAEYFPHVFPGNISLVSQHKPRREWGPPQIISAMGCLDLMDRGATCFPFLLRQNVDSSTSCLRETADLFSARSDGGGGELKSVTTPNISDAAAAYSAFLRSKPETIFCHALAVLHSTGYRVENSGALRQDWPRVPLPKSRDALLASAELGRQVAALLDTESPVDGVTNNANSQLKAIAVLSATANLSLTAGWGHAGLNGVTMPGKGKMQTRAFARDESGAGLGQSTHDIYLNNSACWSNVPEKVWDSTIGGYQVIKKWLSYREFALLGRALTPDEAREVTHIARRIAALILLQPELDRNYQAVKSAPAAWSDYAAVPK